jgi:arabinofuranan 3-O-arabinosyltransferase
VLAFTWWLAPLIVLGRYSPPFLDWIESAAVTTSTASPAAALRGTTHWLPWIRDPEPVWPAGHVLVTSAGLILVSFLLVALSVAGLMLRSTPARAFLVGGVLGGVLLLTVGHVGPLSGPWAGPVQAFLDGPGAALRNTHKFDVVVRLPLALALAHAVARLKVQPVPGASWTRHSVRILAVAAVIAAAAPLFAARAPAPGAFPEIPGYWREAATWLRQHDDGGRTLVLPGAPFADSLWGNPRDEPLQPLADTPWAVRDIVPLSSAGNIRLLTTVEQQLATGRPSPGLAEYLARAGVSRLLVRADLDGVPTRTPRPLTVRSTLSGSPGLAPVASFGPVVGGGRFGDAVADAGLDVLVPALEVWQVLPFRGPAELWERSAALRVAGGPENLLTLAEADLIENRPVVLDGDPRAAALEDAPLVVTDGPQRREAVFSRVRDAWSAPLSPREPWAADRRVHDWTPFAQAQVVAAYQAGVTGVTASSSASASSSAWQAFDGDPGTGWTSGLFATGQEWIRIDLAAPTPMPPTCRSCPATRPASPRWTSSPSAAGNAARSRRRSWSAAPSRSQCRPGRPPGSGSRWPPLGPEPHLAGVAARGHDPRARARASAAAARRPGAGPGARAGADRPADRARRQRHLRLPRRPAAVRGPARDAVGGRRARPPRRRPRGRRVRAAWNGSAAGERRAGRAAATGGQRPARAVLLPPEP